MAYYYSPFRKTYQAPSGACIFCDMKTIERQLIRLKEGPAKNASYYWLVNQYPKFEGHTMLVPQRHLTKLGYETKKELHDREELLRIAVKALRVVFPKTGIEVFCQTGAGSDASVRHLHWHVVPASPRDALRGFDKLGHFYTIQPGAERVLIFPVRIKHSPKELLKALSRVSLTPKRR